MLWIPGTGSWILSFFFVFFLRHVVGLETNRTIDDEFGDSVTGQKPIFLPTTQGIWDGETCTGCRFQPDKAVAFKGTWNTATFRPEVPGGSGPVSFELSFKGTAIYVFLITGNQIAGGIITTLMECNFTLDGGEPEFYQHIPDKSTDFQYNVLAFKRTGLRNVDHIVRATTGGVDYHVLLNFDYAIYTFDDTPEPITTSSTSSLTSSPPNPTNPSEAPAASVGDGGSKRKPPIGAIIGGALGGLAVILGVIVLLCIYRDKRRRRKSPGLPLHTNTTTQYATSPSTRELPQDIQSFTRNALSKPFPPLPSQPSRSRDRKSLRYSVNQPGHRSEPSSSGYSSPESSATGSSAVLTSPQSSSSASIDTARRARQVQLESQLRAAERELREMGVEPQRGPPGPNIPPAMLQTSVYIEYRRLQGEMEEPPPQYSE